MPCQHGWSDLTRHRAQTERPAPVQSKDGTTRLQGLKIIRLLPRVAILQARLYY